MPSVGSMYSCLMLNMVVHTVTTTLDIDNAYYHASQILSYFAILGSPMVQLRPFFLLTLRSIYLLLFTDTSG